MGTILTVGTYEREIEWYMKGEGIEPLSGEYLLPLNIYIVIIIQVNYCRMIVK